MLRCVALLVGLTIGAVGCFIAGDARGDSPAGGESGQDVSKLFELGTKISPKSLAAARERYTELRSSTSAPARLDYAFAVVLIQQRRYDEATQLLTTVTAAEPQSSDAWRLRIWSRMAARHHQAALTDIEAAANVLAKTVAPGHTSRSETAGFLGRMLGFLSGPRAGAVTDARLARARQVLAEQLADERTAIDDGQEMVAQQFSSRREEFEQTQAGATAAQQESRDRTAAELAEEKATVDKQEEAVEASAEKLKADVKDQLASLDKQEAPLQKQLLQLQFQITQVQNALGQIQLQVQTLNAQVAGQKNLAAQVGVQIVQLNNTAVNLQTQLNNLVLQATQLNNQIAQVQARRGALMGEGNSEAQALKQKSQVLKKAETRLAGKQKHLSAASKTRPPQLAALREVQHALATYEPFSYPDETARVLDWYRTAAAARPEFVAPQVDGPKKSAGARK